MASRKQYKDTARSWSLRSMFTRRTSRRRTKENRDGRDYRKKNHMIDVLSGSNSTSADEKLGSERSLSLPLAVWMDLVFPYLTRAEQNILAAAHRDVSLARRQHPWRVRLSWPVGRISCRLSRPAKAVAFAPSTIRLEDGGDTTQAMADELLMVCYCKRSLRIYDKLNGPPQPRKSLATAAPLKIGHKKSVVVDVQFSPSGDTLATGGGKDGAIRLWKQQTVDDCSSHPYTCIRIIHLSLTQMKHIAWSPNGEKIAGWSLDGVIRVVRVADGSFVNGIYWKNRLEVQGCRRTVAFAPGDNELAFAENNDRIMIWNLLQRGQAACHRLPDLQDRHGAYCGTLVTGLTYSPDGSILVVGCHVAALQVWDVRRVSSGGDGNEPAMTNHYSYSHETHLGSGWSAVTLLTFTPDGRFLACSNDGRQIRIMDWSKQEVLATLTGHTERIESLCFTSDGSTLASASCDRTVRFWSMACYG